MARSCPGPLTISVATARAAPTRLDRRHPGPPRADRRAGTRCGGILAGAAADSTVLSVPVGRVAGVSETAVAPVDERVQVPGTALHVRRWPAAGRPFLLVHGLASNARLWDGVAAVLAARG